MGRLRVVCSCVGAVAAAAWIALVSADAGRAADAKLVRSSRVETLLGALAATYENNPTLNAQRAAVRAIDEQVPQALSGYRPQIFGSADIGASWANSKPAFGPNTITTLDPRGAALTAQQTLYNGFQTANQVRSAESQILAARETLRNSEQNVLLDAVTAYMNLLRDQAIVELQRQNIEAVRELLRATRDRFNVGEVTRTDVAQAEARLASAESALSVAQANLNTSRAVYQRVIGEEPGRMAPGRSVENLLPKSVASAVAAGFGEHPAIAAARFGADAAQLLVKVAEGTLLPTLALQATVQQRHDLGMGVVDQTAAQVVARLTVPIYQGGAEYSRIRAAKETAGQRRTEVDVTRDQVRAAVIQSWGLLQASRFQVEAAQAQVRATEIALNGVREEARVGQRTTLDVLNAQAELVNARVALVTAQRDRVVASFSVLASVGRLSAAVLKLNVAIYDPATHYHQVRDAWGGVRTPDGR
jgi:outer membrane protein